MAQEQRSPQYQARDLFNDGISLAKRERWPEALWAFRRSAELVRRASTSYNIANALYRLDRPIDGLEELDQYESMSEVLSSQVARERGETLRRLLESAVATVILAVTPGDAAVFVDRKPIEGTDPVRTIRMNPGLHSLRITHPEHETATRQLDLERGSRQTLPIALQPHTPVAARAIKVAPSSVAVDGTELVGAPVEAPVDDRKRFVKRPGFWLMLGAIAVVGVGTGLAIGLTQRNETPPCGTTGTCATTQGLTLTSF
ncbi:MAG: hypothetical protein HKP50_13025 [Myxococcales bacterium]|nr:hypothetical protein [Myxococcales bacterium]